MFFFFTKLCNIDFQQPGSFLATKGGLGAFESDAIEKGEIRRSGLTFLTNRFSQGGMSALRNWSSLGSLLFLAAAVASDSDLQISTRDRSRPCPLVPL